jgi:hypothetical protein
VYPQILKCTPNFQWQGVHVPLHLKLSGHAAKNATKFSDHPSISSVEIDVKVISIFSSRNPLKGPIILIWANLIKDYPKMLQTKFGDHPSLSSVKEDV